MSFNRSKYISWNNQLVYIPDLYCFLNSLDMKSSMIDPKRFYNDNVLGHLVKTCTKINGERYYQSLSIKTVVELIKRLDSVDIDVPILTYGDHVVDGIHRVIKAVLMNKQRIKYIQLTDDLMSKFFTKH